MAENEDHFYIECVQRGDRASFTYLVDKYKSMAFTVALRVMQSVEDAEDTAQESFVKAFQQIHTFENRSKFSTWLYTIVYRTAVYNLRKNQIQTQQISREISENLETPESNNLKEQEQMKLVKAAIDRLPEMEALLITLFYINENSLNEIKEITGLSISNIKVKLYRARKKIKKELLKYCRVN